MGKMIKRADGSYSQRGLWDNIRANKGSGKKPTKQMLEQEAKIKAKSKYANGGKVPLTAGGEKHLVYKKDSPTGNGKGKKGDIMVNHPTMDKGEWDTINLTEKSGAQTVAEGIAATKKWHAENPEYGMGGYTMYGQGGINNPGFNALPENVQQKILNKMAMGGKIPTNVLKSRLESHMSPEEANEYIDNYGNGGYIVKRSNDRKGKTHVVIGPDGTKKYFGDPNMGEKENSKNGKEAFYARHKHNLANNPYFRAYARKTWGEGGTIGQEFDEYAEGGSIHIKPENKGKFTAWAKSHGMGVQEAASHVMANKDKYSSTIVKRANFAKNASKWKHGDGGLVEYGPGGKTNSTNNRTPIKVTDPNDPNLKAYNDSTALYNYSNKLMRKEFFAPNYSFPENPKLYEDYKIPYNPKGTTITNGTVYKIGITPGVNGWVGTNYKKEVEKSLKTKNKPLGWTNSDISIPVYKKPVQPYVLEKPSNVAAPTVQPTVVKPTYTSPKQFYQGRAFMDSTKLQPGYYHPEEITERMKDPNRKFNNGGMAKYPGGGETEGELLPNNNFTNIPVTDKFYNQPLTNQTAEIANYASANPNVKAGTFSVNKNMPNPVTKPNVNPLGYDNQGFTPSVDTSSLPAQYNKKDWGQQYVPNAKSNYYTYYPTGQTYTPDQYNTYKNSMQPTTVALPTNAMGGYVPKYSYVNGKFIPTHGFGDTTVGAGIKEGGAIAPTLGLAGAFVGDNNSPLGQALDYGAQGASAGMMFGPWGAAIGGGLGLAGGAIKGYMDQEEQAKKQREYDQQKKNASTYAQLMGRGPQSNLSVKTNNQALYAAGGMKVVSRNHPNPQEEVEGGETAITPNGRNIQFRGPKHNNGGIKTNLPAGTRIFSDRIIYPG